MELRKIIFLFIIVSSTKSSGADWFDKSILYADDGGDRTVALPKLKNKEKKEFQHAILTFMGLDEVPKPILRSKDISVPAYMLNLYESLSDENSFAPASMNDGQQKNRYLDNAEMVDLSIADLIMSFVNRETHERQSDSTRLDLSFDVSDVNPGDQLIQAELRVHRNRSRHSDACRLQTCRLVVQLESILSEPSNYTRGCAIAVPIDGPGEWISVNVTSALALWLNNPGIHSRLQLHMETSRGASLSSLESGLDGGFLVGFFKADKESKRSRRTKRSDRTQNRGSKDPTGNHYKSSSDYDWDNNRLSRRSCQKRTLYVSFRDLGWQDWIIAPDGYAAYYCAGECSFPLNAHMNATNHAIVQTLVHLMDPHRASKPCCAPNKLDPISVLYFDDFSNVVLKKYNNMVVRSCGCH